MRGVARQRALAKLIGLFGVLALLCVACSNDVDGEPSAVDIPPASAAESINQALLNFGESAAVRYQGTLTSASDEKLGFDLTAALTGEIVGTVTVDGTPAAILVINKALYVKAPAAFWGALRGIGNGEGKGTAIADRWVKLPSVLLGIEFGEIFAPDVISQNLAKESRKPGDGALTDGKKSTVAGVEAVEVPVERGTAYLAAKAPHGVVKIELDKFGNTDNTRVSDLVAEVSDGSAGIGKFYQDLAVEAAKLNTAVDALTTIEQGAHKFDSCAAESCSLIVEFTNTSKVPVRVHVKADWTGDNAPLGSCEAQVGPVAPGQPGSATCVLNSPQWADFYRNAHSVVGEHPYGAEWSALVLADAPDLSAVNARAGAKPADPRAKKTEGSHYVYAISYSDKVWKYGVVGSKYWQDHAKQQLRTCLATTQALCFFSLVTAADEPASAYALEQQLVEGYRTEKGSCPTGQWVGCKP